MKWGRVGALRPKHRFPTIAKTTPHTLLGLPWSLHLAALHGGSLRPKGHFPRLGMTCCTLLGPASTHSPPAPLVLHPSRKVGCYFWGATPCMAVSGGHPVRQRRWSWTS